METTTRHDFRLNFLTNRSELMTLNIPHANILADGDQIAEAMYAIIDSDIVESVRGVPLQRHSAERVTTDRSEYDVL